MNDTAADWNDSAFMVIKAYAQSPPQSNPPGYFTEALLLSLDNFQPNTWRDLVIDVASFPEAMAPNDFDKANAIRDYCVKHGIALDKSHAYSDSASDYAMLAVVGRPTAVNPDLRLRSLARAYNWPILNLN